MKMKTITAADLDIFEEYGTWVAAYDSAAIDFEVSCEAGSEAEAEAELVKLANEEMARQHSDIWGTPMDEASEAGYRADRERARHAGLID